MLLTFLKVSSFITLKPLRARVLAGQGEEEGEEGSQRGMPDPLGSRESGRGKGREGMPRPLLLALLWERRGGAWPHLARTGALF